MTIFVRGERGSGLSEEETIRVLRPIAAALDYAHGKGVVHRDVKPGNVMIAKDGTPYILDFGIAREIQETLTRVTGKLSSGTLLYMSPEQLNGEQPTPAQDVYSFAAMAYECLKGEPPFVRGAIEDQIKNKLPAPLVGHDDPVESQSIAASVMAGLAKKPVERPMNCSAVLRGRDILQVGDPPVGTLREDGTSSGGTWKAFSVVAALALAAFGGWWWRYREQPIFKAQQSSPVGDINKVEDEGKDATVVTNASPNLQMGKGINKVTEMRGEANTVCEPLPPPVAYTSKVERVVASTMQRPSPMKKSGWTVATNFVVCGGKNRSCMEITSPDKTELRLVWCGDGTNGFWMGETEVTGRQWYSVMGNGGTVDVDRAGLAGDYPIAKVRYEECRQFMKKLQKETGLAFSLPDTNSWQIACLAGSKTSYWWGDDCFDLAEGNFKTGVSEGRAMKVKSYKPNGWGLFDMHGNVAEWCDGRYVVGGNYGSDARDCNASSFKVAPDDSYMSTCTGLRVFLKENDR